MIGANIGQALAEHLFSFGPLPIPLGIISAVMPRTGAIVFSDLIGKLDVLRVSCSQCARDGCYGLSRLMISVAVMPR